jgi:peptidoglycan/LPS O-acetylase OafA/YrhL
MRHGTRIPSLDGLRAISIALVIVDHLGFGAPYFGALGVQVFFVTSGYLITRLLQEEREARGQISIAGFYIRRAVRILPAALVFIAFAALVSPASRPDVPYALSYTMCYRLHPSSMLLLHMWSLSVEEQFYLLWPCALVFAFRRRADVALTAVVIAAVFRAGCVVMYRASSPFLMHCSFPGVMDSIAVGCLLAVYEPRLRQAVSSPSRIAVVLFPAATFGAVFVLWRNTFNASLAAVSPARALFWGIIPIFIAACIFCAVGSENRLLNNRLMSTCGAMSYSIYLWQQPFTKFHSSATVLDVTLLILLASISYLLIEKPMTNLGKSLSGALCRASAMKPTSSSGGVALPNAT